jgi:hypothetical protein
VIAERLQIVMLRLIMASCILSVFAPYALNAQTAEIRIRLLDGHTGSSLSGMKLDLLDYHNDNPKIIGPLEGRASVDTLQDGNYYTATPKIMGILVLSYFGLAGASITPYTRCSHQKFYDSNTRTYGNEHLYPVSTIVESGLVTKNDCSNKTATAKPGELVIFVRPVHWWERWKAAFEE